MNEVRLPIPGYEGRYEVSDMGRVYSLNYKRSGKCGELKPGLCGAGYLMVCLRKDGTTKTFKVATLVAMAFLGHKPNGHKITIDHFSRDKTDNRLENLRLCSMREQAQNRRDRKNQVPLDLRGKIRAQYQAGWYNYAELGRMYGISAVTVKGIVERKSLCDSEELEIARMYINSLRTEKELAQFKPVFDREEL